jgi:hypothetical protein
MNIIINTESFQSVECENKIKKEKKKSNENKKNKQLFPWETFNYNQPQLTDHIKYVLKKMDIIDNTGFAISKNGCSIRCCLCGAIPVINIKQNTVTCSYNSASKSRKTKFELNEFYSCSYQCSQYFEKIAPEIKKRKEEFEKKKEDEEFEKRFLKEKKYQEYKLKRDTKTDVNNTPQIIHYHNDNVVNNIVEQIACVNGNIFSENK